MKNQSVFWPCFVAGIASPAYIYETPAYFPYLSTVSVAQNFCAVGGLLNNVYQTHSMDYYKNEQIAWTNTKFTGTNGYSERNATTAES